MEMEIEGEKVEGPASPKGYAEASAVVFASLRGSTLRGALLCYEIIC